MPIDPRPNIESAMQRQMHTVPTRELGRRIVDESIKMREALIKIAIGDGYYGSQAREYKNIARSTLGLPLI